MSIECITLISCNTINTHALDMVLVCMSLMQPTMIFLINLAGYGKVFAFFSEIFLSQCDAEGSAFAVLRFISASSGCHAELVSASKQNSPQFYSLLIFISPTREHILSPNLGES